MQYKLNIVMYHYVRELQNSRYPAIKGLDYNLFKKQIDFFEQAFHIITMEQVLDAVWNKAALPDKALLLTFDDGYIDHYTCVLPILKEHGIQGSFFIPGKTFTENVLLDVNKIHFVLASAPEEALLQSLLEKLNFYRGEGIYNYPSNQELYEEYAKPSRFDKEETVFIKRMLQTVLPEELRNVISSELFEKFVGIKEDKFARELYMNADQIRLMKSEGMFIGLHGYDHYWLGNLEKQAMETDVKKALEVMEPFIDRNEWVMNYPYGSRNNETIEFIQSQGCRLGLVTEVGVADLDKDSPFELPRLDTNDFPPKSENYMKFGE